MERSKNIIGGIIQRKRKKLGLTQQDLADRMEVDKQYIWKLENGKINMSLDYIDKVIDKLDCKHEEFFNKKV
jgi:transcriptional regulator with XRE-family HTH domain